MSHLNYILVYNFGILLSNFVMSIISAVSFFMDMTDEDSPARQRTFRKPLTDMITIMQEFATKNPSSITSIVGTASRDSSAFKQHEILSRKVLTLEA